MGVDSNMAVDDIQGVPHQGCRPLGYSHLVILFACGIVIYSDETHLKLLMTVSNLIQSDFKAGYLHIWLGMGGYGWVRVGTGWVRVGAGGCRWVRVDPCYSNYLV